jgi:multicomponent Na+:H+ antiporter subunit G
MLLNTFTIIMLLLGCFFFVAGTVGLIRFPDVFCRLHALTKSDNLGLGLIVIGLLPQTNSFSMAIKLILVWLLLLIASAASCHLIARNEYRKQMQRGSLDIKSKESNDDR